MTNVLEQPMEMRVTADAPDIVAIAADWHGSVKWARHAVEYAYGKGADGIVQLGDFGLWPGWDMPGSDAWMFLNGVQDKLAECGMWLDWLDGNHEDHPAINGLVRQHGHHNPIPIPGFDRIRYLPRGYQWSWWGKTFMAIGGAVSVDKTMRTEGRSWWPEEELTDEDIAHASRSQVDVILAHDCPLGVDIPGVGRSLRTGNGNGWPYHALLDAERHRTKMRDIWLATRPKLWLHGHYHVRYEYGMRHTVTGANTRFVGLADDDQIMKDNVLILTERDV